MGHKTLSMTLRYIEIADAYQAKHQEKAMEGIFPKEIEGATAAFALTLHNAACMAAKRELSA